MHKKKLLAKTCWKNALFSLLLMFVKIVLLITFFGAFFNNFFNGFEISNFEAKRAKNGSKNQKMYFVNVS